MNKRKPAISVIGDEYTDEDEIYCPMCKKVGIKSKMQPLDPIEAQQKQYHADEYLYCPYCKRDSPVHTVQGEGGYQPAFDLVKTHYESGSEFASVEPRKKKPKRNANKIHQTDDPDILSEKGNVNVVFDSGNY